jgi:hypothetical protein
MRETPLAHKPAADMEFPAHSGFNPQPPRLSPTDFIRWCEEMMDVTPLNRDNPEQRFAQKGRQEFSC